MNKDILEIEANELNQYQKELEELKGKWFKTSKTKEYINFLSWYIEERKKFIGKIEEKLK